LGFGEDVIELVFQGDHHGGHSQRGSPWDATWKVGGLRIPERRRQQGVVGRWSGVFLGLGGTGAKLVC
jgi:hypothetical protein